MLDRPTRLSRHRPFLLCIATCCLGLLLWQCGAGQIKNLKGDEAYFAEGKRAMEKKRYTQAIEKLQRLVSNFPGSPHIAEAQFMLAEAYFFTKDFVNAAFEYQRLIDGYPTTEWVDDAQFKIAESFFLQSRRPELDQKETYDALSYYRRFLEDYADSPLAPIARERILECRERLAKKQFLNGRLYQRQGHWRAAELAYQEILRDFPDVPSYYYRTLYEMGQVKQRLGKDAEARASLEEVVRDCGDEELVAKARQLLSEAEVN